ncbi:MAG: flagellar biosynthetic protein FliR [Treponema sp.]|nr:flagellar biosynthetic protein FliR [Treponema sp.]MBQ2600879.1 flagellar biosynthetic protein FliR [Treponema sp.]
MLQEILARAPVYLLVAVRCFAFIMTLPLFSSRTVSRIAKVTLAIYFACLIAPRLSASSGAFSVYATFLTPEGTFNLIFILLLIGEGLIGIIMGFFINMIFSAFSTAGQFFAFQMGFAASEVYDALSQVENPLMGQYLNLVAMLVFMQTGCFRTLFSDGLLASFDHMSAISIVEHNEEMVKFLLMGLTKLFRDAIIIALPLMGTLFLINVAMGILAKASPQMNLLAEGFPVLILTSFFVLTVLLPYFINFADSSFAIAFQSLGNFFRSLGGGGGS